MNLADYTQYGTPFCVGCELIGNSATTDLIIPAAPTKPNVGAMAGDQKLNDRVIVLAYQYDFTAADGNGFDLGFFETAFSPALSHYIHKARASTAITSKNFACECFIPGPDAIYSPATAAARLRVVTTATGPTRGWISVQGIVIDSDYRWGFAPFRGSPVTL